jgi:hypothetical protein
MAYSQLDRSAIPRWCIDAIPPLKEIQGHHELIASLCSSAEDLPSPNAPASVRRESLTRLLTTCLLFKSNAASETRAAIAAHLASAFPASGISDDFLADGSDEPFSAIEYSIELVNTCAELQRVQLLGQLNPGPLRGRFYTCNADHLFTYQRTQFQGGTVVRSAPSSAAAAIYELFRASYPAWICSSLQIRVIEGAETAVAEKPFGLGDWQLKLIQTESVVELITFGPYVVFGHRRMPSANKCK